MSGKITKTRIATVAALLLLAFFGMNQMMVQTKTPMPTNSSEFKGVEVRLLEDTYDNRVSLFKDICRPDYIDEGYDACIKRLLTLNKERKGVLILR